MDTAQAQPAPSPTAGSTPEDDKRSLVLQVAAAVATGIGILGFVVFFGGAILWVRFDQAGLPANDAVAVVSKPVLLTTGASFLAPVLLLALGAVAALLGLNLALDTLRAYRESQLDDDPVALQRAADTKRAEARQWLASAGEVRAVREAWANLPASGGNSGDDDQTQLAAREVELLRSAAESEREASELARQAAAAFATVKTASSVEELTVEKRRLVTGIFLAAVAVAELVFIAGQQALAVSLGTTLALIALALATAIFSWFVFRKTQELLWLGVAVFISVGIFAGAATYARTVKDPKIEAVALLRNSEHSAIPVTGFFVAETSDRVYVGTHADTAGLGGSKLLVLASEDVTDIAVSELLSPDEAASRSVELALELCEQELRLASSGQANNQRGNGGQACSEEQRRTLQDRIDRLGRQS
jgi:hypothetical protein